MTRMKDTPTTFEAAGYTFEVVDPVPGMHYAFASSSPEPGVTELALTLSADTPVVPARTSLVWTVPVVDIHYKWNPEAFRHRYLDVMSDCANSFHSGAHGAAPVMSLYNMAGTNALTFALSDALHRNALGISLDERGFLRCTVGLFQEPWDAITEYRCTLRLDQRRIPYYTVLKETGDWWEQSGLARCIAPEAATMPFFSTWYSHHGDVTQDDVLQQARLARELGVDSIIVDAGWGVPLQTRLEPFPDLPGTVKAVQALGVNIMLWTDPSQPNPTNEGLLGDDRRLGMAPGKTGRFDPRYPEVRAELVREYLHLLDLSDCDGFKIDFINSIPGAPDDDRDDPRRDYKSVPEAVDAMMGEIYQALQERKPDILIEYRQRYTGPHMWRHCTMMRAVDCGNSYPDNRQRTLDLRLLNGSLPVHADPIIWHPDEPVVSAALHLQHTLFSVPQVSVKLETLPPAHRDMIRTYLAFWREHRDVIWSGELMPLAPQDSFPVVLSRTDHKLLAGVFADTVVPLPRHLPEQLLIVNAGFRDRVVLELPAAAGKRRLTVTTVTGERRAPLEIVLAEGIHTIPIPASGYAVMEAC
jgi:alpha-galactosidase